MPAVGRPAMFSTPFDQQILSPKQRKEASPTNRNATKLKFTTQYMKKLTASQARLNGPLASHKCQNKRLVNMLPLTLVMLFIVILPAHIYHFAKPSYGCL
jgi:hypothetical protein